MHQSETALKLHLSSLGVGRFCFKCTCNASFETRISRGWCQQHQRKGVDSQTISLLSCAAFVIKTGTEIPECRRGDGAYSYNNNVTLSPPEWFSALRWVATWDIFMSHCFLCVCRAKSRDSVHIPRFLKIDTWCVCVLKSMLSLYG